MIKKAECHCVRLHTSLVETRRVVGSDARRKGGGGEEGGGTKRRVKGVGVARISWRIQVSRHPIYYDQFGISNVSTVVVANSGYSGI